MKPETLVQDIIKEQSQIIGENLAISRAKSSGAVIFSSNSIEGLQFATTNYIEALEKVIGSYEEVFGKPHLKFVSLL